MGIFAQRKTGTTNINPSMPFPLDESTIFLTLQTGETQLQGQFVQGSNYTFLVNITLGETQLTAVYKPMRGEQPLWDFPSNSLSKREVAAYLVSQALGWDLVPPTLFRRKKLPLGAGSLQYYIDHQPNTHFFNFTPIDRDRLRPAVVFDLLINNADRKGGHFLRAEDGHIWLIDHGVCFHVEDKLRTVAWDFAGEELPANLLTNIKELLPQLEKEAALAQALKPLLRPAEINALRRRATRLLDHPIFPQPPQDRRAFPWPPV